MYRIIGGDGREYGPVSAAQVEQWIAQNRANGRTQIKAEGAADWVPLGELPEFAGLLAARNAPPPLPGQEAATAAPATGDAVVDPSVPVTPVADTPSLIRPPSPARPRRDPAEAARACVGREYRLSVFDTISRGWDILERRFWFVVGGTFLGSVANSAAGSVPVVGILATILLTQVFYAGIYWMILRLSRGEPAELGDLFAGFTRSFGELVKLSAAMFLGLFSLAAIAMGPLLWVLLRSDILHGGKPEPAELVGPMLAMPLLLIPMIYFSVSWIFAPILVIDRGLGFWEALEISRRVVTKRWFRLFGLCLAFVPLTIAGLLCFIVGIFVVVALMYATFIAAYENAFADGAGSAPVSDRPAGSADPRD